jgi:hypothetical protein
VPLSAPPIKDVTICYLGLIAADKKGNHTERAVKNVSKAPKIVIFITAILCS